MTGPTVVADDELVLAITTLICEGAAGASL
jgi:hypothetical protein